MDPPSTPARHPASRRPRPALLALSAATWLITACGTASPPLASEAVALAPGRLGPVADTPAVAAMAEGDRRLVIEVAAGMVYPLEAARLAEQRTQHPQVLAYAALLVKEHTAAFDELQQLARERGLAVPEVPLPDQRRAVDALQSLTGEAFDQRFVQQIGVRQHEAVVGLCETLAARAVDAGLRGWAARQLPMLRQHLAAARRLPVTVQAHGTGTGARGTPPST